MTDYAIPPGETIQEIMEDSDLGYQSFAASLGINVDDLKKLFKGDVEINEAFAEKLDDVLKIPKTFWFNLEKNYRDNLANFVDKHKPKTLHIVFKGSDLEKAYYIDDFLHSEYDNPDVGQMEMTMIDLFFEHNIEEVNFYALTSRGFEEIGNNEWFYNFSQFTNHPDELITFINNKETILYKNKTL